jgi:hypothetical protein
MEVALAMVIACGGGISPAPRWAALRGENLLLPVFSNLMRCRS